MVLRKKRLSWLGHVMQRNEDDRLSRIQEVVAPRRRPRGSPKKPWHDCVNPDLQETGISESLTVDRDEWKAVKNRLTSSREGRRSR